MTTHRAPITHISELASVYTEYCIQMIPARDLAAALDCSTDLRHDLGDTMEEHFGPLLDDKLAGCTDYFLTNLVELGIQEPIVIIVRSDSGEWQMDEGHHRLRWGLINNTELPVIFCECGLDDDCQMGYLVARKNANVTHSTTEEDAYAWAARVAAEAEELLPTWEAPEPITDVIPAQRAGRHRKGGKHRAAS